MFPVCHWEKRSLCFEPGECSGELGQVLNDPSKCSVNYYKPQLAAFLKYFVVYEWSSHKLILIFKDNLRSSPCMLDAGLGGNIPSRCCPGSSLSTRGETIWILTWAVKQNQYQQLSEPVLKMLALCSSDSWLVHELLRGPVHTGVLNYGISINLPKKGCWQSVWIWNTSLGSVWDRSRSFWNSCTYLISWLRDGTQD